MLRSESSSRMWIGAVCGLLASDHVYSQGNQHNRKKKRTSAVGTRQVLGPVQLFRWFEGKRKKVRDETCRKRKVLSVDEVVPEAAEGRRCTDGVRRVSGRRTASIRSVILRSARDAFVLSPLPPSDGSKNLRSALILPTRHSKFSRSDSNRAASGGPTHPSRARFGQAPLISDREALRAPVH